MADAFKTIDSKLFIDPTQMKTYLSFDGDKIYVKERGITIVDLTTKQFVEQFDKLVFKDKEGNKTTFKKEEVV